MGGCLQLFSLYPMHAAVIIILLPTSAANKNNDNNNYYLSFFSFTTCFTIYIAGPIVPKNNACLPVFVNLYKDEEVFKVYVMDDHTLIAPEKVML